MRPNEIQLTLHGRNFAAQSWGEKGGLPVLALHGWLDNSASFYRLAPAILALSSEPLHLIALDLAGHGWSDHRQAGEPYNIWQDVADVFGLADQLGWQQFALVGHSRGAIISALAAGTFPQRITQLGLIDGLWPRPVDPAAAPELLAQSILDNSNPRKLRRKVYPNLETMVDVLQHSRWSLNRATAEALVSRGVQEVEGGYSWRADPHLRTASAFKLSQNHIDAFAARIEAKTLLVVAEEGLPELRSCYLAEQIKIRHCQSEVLAGGHHLHTEDSVDDVARLLYQLFTQ